LTYIFTITIQTVDLYISQIPVKPCVLCSPEICWFFAVLVRVFYTVSFMFNAHLQAIHSKSIQIISDKTCHLFCLWWTKKNMGEVDYCWAKPCWNLYFTLLHCASKTLAVGTYSKFPISFNFKFSSLSFYKIAINLLEKCFKFHFQIPNIVYVHCAIFVFLVDITGNRSSAFIKAFLNLFG